MSHLYPIYRAKEATLLQAVTDLSPVYLVAGAGTSVLGMVLALMHDPNAILVFVFNTLYFAILSAGAIYRGWQWMVGEYKARKPSKPIVPLSDDDMDRWNGQPK